MIRSWKFWGVLSAIGAVVALFAYGFTVDPKLVPSPLVGKPAADFTVQQLNGEGALTLSDLQGTPVLLNFWASWCVACRDEAAILQEAHLLYDVAQNRLRVIGVAIQDTPEKALAFAERFGKTYFLALDDEAGTIGLDYGLYGVPETFFIDAGGRIQYKQVGAVTRELIRTMLDEMADEMASPKQEKGS
ncbi:MAG: DsbE family thiol:disulfide interchange protein [SAR324 cluster bacterium]|nr:DsbE family thiol:disulfide interchange protein [SAR324 cluster bacterium]